MTCFTPLNAWQSMPGTPVVFTPSNVHKNPLQIACGQCIGCRLERSRQWATRCLHEAQMHEDNCFITLTYNEDNLPWDGSLNKKHFQTFMKRLRWHNKQKKIRFFHCGEYGNELQRPHYHALLFGHDFTDKELWSNVQGVQTYTSKQLSKLWPWGFSTIGQLTWETAAYTSRYVMKKMTGKDADAHYYNQVTEDLAILRQPEYITMSLKPAIGKTWYETYKRDCYPKDFITNRGKKFKVPSYYDYLLEKESETEFKQIKATRLAKAYKWQHENTPKRLKARQKCTEARLQTLKRSYEG